LRQRLFVACFLIALMAFSLSILLPTGERFEGFTTSDSWWFYKLAYGIAQTDGMLERDNLSHPPTGHPVGIGDQLQPLIGAMVYEGLHSFDQEVTIEEVARYLPCILFISMLIPVFLIGREFAGNVGGCAAAFFLAMMMSGVGTTSPLYWSKVGGFDREVLMQVMGAWIAYFMISVLKNPRLQPAIAGGLVYGLFAVLWAAGAVYFIPVALLAAALMVLNEGLTRGKPKWSLGSIGGVMWGGFRANIEPFRALAIMFAVGGLLGWFFTGFGFSIGLPLAILSMALLAFVPLYRRYRRRALWVAVVGAVVIGLLTLPYWLSYVVWALEIAGLKAPLVELPKYAAEMQRPDWEDQLKMLYGAKMWDPATASWVPDPLGWPITFGVLLLLLPALGAMLLTRKRHELFLHAWLLGLVVLANSQVRFFRQWWPMLAVLVGIGFVMVLSWSWKAIGEPTVSSSSLGDVFRKPLIIAICVFFLSAAFIQNARAQAERTGPPTGGLHKPLLDVSEWIKANTPENSVVAVQWSYGHQVAAWAKRPAVVDGCESIEEEGKWERELKPKRILPDYIYRVVGGKAVFLKDLTDTPPWGRRDDVDWLLTTGSDDEFEELVSLYRDNYDIAIKYIVFTGEDLVWARITYPHLDYHLGRWYYAIKRPGETARSIRGTYPNLTFEFTAENVTFNMADWVATSDGAYLAGIIPIGVLPDGTRVPPHLYRLTLPPAYRGVGAPKVLWVEFSLGVTPEGKPVITGVRNAGLTDVSMTIRAFVRTHEMPFYLREQYRSPRGPAVVYEIQL